jgi:hypothetical protein
MSTLFFIEKLLRAFPGKNTWRGWNSINNFVKLGITGKESSAFGSFPFPFGEGKRGSSFQI